MALLQQLENAIKSSLSDAITEVFLIGACLMVVCFIATLFLKEAPLRKSHTREGGAGASQTTTEASEPIAGEAAAPFGT